MALSTAGSRSFRWTLATMTQDKPPILLLSSGHCGGTLLHRIVNTSKEVCIWGEHNGFLRPLAVAYDRLTSHHLIQPEYYQKPSMAHLAQGALDDFESPIKWANSFEREDVVTSFRELIRSLLTQGVDTTQLRWGFKEIRYRSDEAFMPMWQELFPKTSCVFLVRHPLAVIQSMLLEWQQPETDALTQESALPYLKWAAGLWLDVNRAIVDWHADPQIASHLVKFEELERSPQRVVKELFGFLDLPKPGNAVVPCKHKTSVSRSSEIAPRARQLIMDSHLEIQSIVGETALQLGYSDLEY